MILDPFVLWVIPEGLLFEDRLDLWRGHNVVVLNTRIMSSLCLDVL